MTLLLSLLPLLVFGLMALGAGLLCDRFILRNRIKSRLRARLGGLALGALILSVVWVILTQTFVDPNAQSGMVAGIALISLLSFVMACLFNSLSLWRFWKARYAPTAHDIFG